MTKLPTQTRKVFLKHIDLDSRLQPRDGINEKVVEKLMEAIQNGAKLPAAAVFFDGNRNLLAGGRHRYEANKRLGFKHLECDIYEGTFEDAWLFSRGDNNHGEPLNNKEKNRAVEEMLSKPDIFAWSDRAIAAHVGVSDKFVGSVRRKIPAPTANGSQSSQRVGRDGRAINTANIGKSAPVLPPPAPTVEDSPEEDDEFDDTDPFAPETDEEPEDDDDFDDSDPFKEEVTWEDISGETDAEDELRELDESDSDPKKEEESNAVSEPEKEAPTPEPDPPKEPTIDEIIDAMPLAQALELYGHKGHIFRQQARAFFEVETVIKAAQRKKSALRYNEGPITAAILAVADLASPDKWEGCANCKGSGRVGERADPCNMCKGGFTIRPTEGVSADVVRSHAEPVRD